MLLNRPAINSCDDKLHSRVLELVPRGPRGDRRYRILRVVRDEHQLPAGRDAVPAAQQEEFAETAARLVERHRAHLRVQPVEPV